MIFGFKDCKKFGFFRNKTALRSREKCTFGEVRLYNCIAEFFFLDYFQVICFCFRFLCLLLLIHSSFNGLFQIKNPG